MSGSIRDKIKAAQDRPEETVEIPEWGVALRVRGMSAADASGLSKVSDSESYAQRMLALCVCDEVGSPVYTTPEDAAEIMAKSLPIVKRLLSAANRVNGIAEEGEKKD